MKKISQLTLSDFEAHPIWAWAEDDNEDMVCPIVDRVDKEEHDALFIRSNFIFNDGTTVSGFVAVRMRDQHIYSIALANRWGKLMDLPVSSELRPLVNMEALKDVFGKNSAEIFPIHYSTGYLPFLGTQYKGLIIEYT